MGDMAGKIGTGFSTFFALKIQRRFGLRPSVLVYSTFLENPSVLVYFPQKYQFEVRAGGTFTNTLGFFRSNCARNHFRWLIQDLNPQLFMDSYPI